MSERPSISERRLRPIAGEVPQPAASARGDDDGLHWYLTGTGRWHRSSMRPRHRACRRRRASDRGRRRPRPSWPLAMSRSKTSAMRMARSRSGSAMPSPSSRSCDTPAAVIFSRPIHSPCTLSGGIAVLIFTSRVRSVELAPVEGPIRGDEVVVAALVRVGSASRRIHRDAEVGVGLEQVHRDELLEEHVAIGDEHRARTCPSRPLKSENASWVVSCSSLSTYVRPGSCDRLLAVAAHDGDVLDADAVEGLDHALQQGLARRSRPSPLADPRSARRAPSRGRRRGRGLAAASTRRRAGSASRPSSSSLAPCRRKTSLTGTTRSSTLRRLSSSCSCCAVCCMAVNALRIRWLAQITTLTPASRNTSVGRVVVLGRHDHDRTAIAPLLHEGEDLVRLRLLAVDEDRVGPGSPVGLGALERLGQCPSRR